MGPSKNSVLEGRSCVFVAFIKAFPFPMGPSHHAFQFMWVGMRNALGLRVMTWAGR